jgi:hypothetical protein
VLEGARKLVRCGAAAAPLQGRRLCWSGSADQPLVKGLIFVRESVALSGCQSYPERHGAQQSIELVSGVL